MITNKDIEYIKYTLGDIKVIELLVAYRYKYDAYLFSGTTDSLLTVDGVLPVSEEMLVTYADLDVSIKECNFDEFQLRLLKLIEQGYTHEEISEKLSVFSSTISGRLRTIYKAIHKNNDWKWRKTIYTDKLLLKTKNCIKCKNALPATHEFFRADDRNKSGYQGRCRRCEI